MAASSPSGLSVDVLSTPSFVVFSVAASSLDREMCEDRFGGEVVVVVAVSGDKLDKKTKTNEIQNYIYFSTAIHFVPGAPGPFSFRRLRTKHPKIVNVDSETSEKNARREKNITALW